MNKYPLFKLVQWLIKSVVYSLIINLIISYTLFALFTDRPFSDFLLIFFYGFFISFVIFTILSIRLLHPLSKVIQKIKILAEGHDSFDKNEHPFLNEPGEFYNTNKHLNQISDHLISQKKIINQESSELEAVISAVTGAILAIDQDRKILFFNNQAVMLFAPNKKTKVKNLFLSEIIRNPDILSMYQECLKTHKIIKKTLSLHAFSKNEETVYEITIAPLEEVDNNFKGAVGLFYDITNITRAEKIQVDFISNVSHELRTPLTAIQGYVQTLLSQLKTSQKDEIEKFLKIISRNVERLVSLLNHFLELSQMESSLDLKKEKLSTEEITRSIVKDLHIKDDKIRLDFVAKTVRADSHFLRQILYNLLDNAIRYAPQGRLIEVIWSKGGDDEVVLTVKDQGEGISAYHRGRLFERFYRVDPSRAKTKGAGIGLSIVKQLIEKHGGTIKILSEEREGSAFICTFPNN